MKWDLQEMLQIDYFSWIERYTRRYYPAELFDNPRHERTKEFLEKVLNK